MLSPVAITIMKTFSNIFKNNKFVLTICLLQAVAL